MRIQDERRLTEVATVWPTLPVNRREIADLVAQSRFMGPPSKASLDTDASDERSAGQITSASEPVLTSEYGYHQIIDAMGSIVINFRRVVSGHTRIVQRCGFGADLVFHN